METDLRSRNEKASNMAMTNSLPPRSRRQDACALIPLVRSLCDSRDMYTHSARLRPLTTLGVFFSGAAGRRAERLEALHAQLRARGIDRPVSRSLIGSLHLFLNTSRNVLDAVRGERLLRACLHRDGILLQHYDTSLALARTEEHTLCLDLTLQRSAIVSDLQEGTHYLNDSIAFRQGTKDSERHFDTLRACPGGK